MGTDETRMKRLKRATGDSASGVVTVEWERDRPQTFRAPGLTIAAVKRLHRMTGEFAAPADVLQVLGEGAELIPQPEAAHAPQ